MLKNSVVKLSSRKLVQVEGKDASRFLQGILTNDITKLKRRSSMYASFLTAKGRILGDCNVIRVNEETFWVDYDASSKEDLQNHWKRYKLRMKVSIEDRSDQYNILALLPALYRYPDLQKPSLDGESAFFDELKTAYGSRHLISTDPRARMFGIRAIVEGNDESCANACSNIAIVHEAFESADASIFDDRRIFLGAAEGSELHDLIPLEANLDALDGVSFSKGCYVGQELMARTHFKGLVRKRIIPCAILPAGDQAKEFENLQAAFRSIDDKEAIPLREYLLNTSASAGQRDVQRGTKVICTETLKPIGSIVAVAPGIRAALAMIRLEHLLHSHFTTSDGAFRLIPYQPFWWDRLDSSSGKILMTST